MSFIFRPASGSYDAAELAAQGLVPYFETQSQAELWLGDHFDLLLEAGVAEVTLFEDDQRVYGPMSLEP